MKRILTTLLLAVAVTAQTTLAIEAPAGLVIISGDSSSVLHWAPNAEINLAGYNVYRSLSLSGPFTMRNSSLVTNLGYCDLAVTNGQEYFYRITAQTTSSQESPPSATVSTTPNPFTDDDAFLDYIQQANFDYFWYSANPANGLVPDRSAAGSTCSIAAEGFGLTAIGIGIDHGWISRDEGAARVLTALTTFLFGPQGTNTSGIIGYQGWFYHFLDMKTATRAPNSELSSIDTALLLAGVLYDKQYFNSTNATETSIRATADAIFSRVNWTWMSQGTDAVAMGWQPTTGFSGFGNWSGYNEGMILYLLGMGTTTNPLPASAWNYWTSAYTWATYYGETYVPFGPLFGHEYSHCWIDFRHLGDAYMNGHNCTYFENSRRATLAQIAYCVANPSHWPGYGSNVWGLTACDDPLVGYQAHGAPPSLNDNGTLAPTAAGGAMAFAPDYALPILEYLYHQYRTNLWTANGFRDAFNLRFPWYDTDELGIDQGPIVIMIENYRTQRVWKLFMQNVEIQRGLQQAGFVSLPFVPATVHAVPDQGYVYLTWDSSPGKTYQVEYSSDLFNWFTAPNGEVNATGASASWIDNGPPGTLILPFNVSQRFYRVFKLGPP